MNKNIKGLEYVTIHKGEVILPLKQIEAYTKDVKINELRK